MFIPKAFLREENLDLVCYHSPEALKRLRNTNDAP